MVRLVLRSALVGVVVCICAGCGERTTNEPTQPAKPAESSVARSLSDDPTCEQYQRASAFYQQAFWKRKLGLDDNETAAEVASQLSSTCSAARASRSPIDTMGSPAAIELAKRVAESAARSSFTRQDVEDRLEQLVLDQQPRSQSSTTIESVTCEGPDTVRAIGLETYYQCEIAFDVPGTSTKRAAADVTATAGVGELVLELDGKPYTIE